MAEAMYAVPDLTKVRYRREREQETEDRGEREERLVDIYVSADDLDPGADPDPGPGPGPGPGTQQDAVQQNTTQQQHGASDESRKKNAFKAATVCLGVLCVILLAGITGLGVHNSKLIKENNNLTKALDQMTKQNDDLQFRHNNVTAQKDQSSYDHLQSKYNNLTKDMVQMTEQKDQCQSSYNNVTAERDELKRKLCDHGWQRFGSSCYFISTEEKTWKESRTYCGAKQSDLIIINSKEEQEFVTRVVNWGQNVWLGLTDREDEGVWKWVDGTPLTSPTYWRSGEPNDHGGGEDCAGTGRDGWYDESCTRTWKTVTMCEK